MNEHGEYQKAAARRLVRLAAERDHAIAEAARSMVRNTHDALDILASADYDELVGLVDEVKPGEGEG